VGVEPWVWCRASRCSANACVEVAFAEGSVWLRSSKTPEVAPLRFSPQEWAVFSAAISEGEFAVPE
jgi:hypothetical protein